MKPLWKVINRYMCAYTYIFNYIHIHRYIYVHIYILHIHIKLICLYLCSAQNVKVMQSETSVGKRPSRLFQGSQVSTQSSECQSGSKQARVHGRSNRDNVISA